jgi:pyruvate dehydrogenase E1 component alpha subunit
MKPSTGNFLQMYRKMLRIRLFEQQAMELFKRGKIFGGVHLYLGEEAVAVGVCSALTEEDYIASTHRGHGHVIAKGARPDRMMAELLGKRTGYCCGKGGSMHIADTTLNILGANGIVGGGIALATGAALSAKLRESRQVAVSFFGDGATNQGSFHESLNMAGAHHLPVIYVCENNLYSVFTSQAEVRAVDSIASRAASYGFPGVAVNGNDVLAVYQASITAVDRARDGGGPTLIEAQTYRHRGHFEGDIYVRSYRPEEEENYWLSRDPIALWEERLKGELNAATTDDLEGIKDSVTLEILEAVRFAEGSPWPDPGDALTGAYAQGVKI